VIKHVPSFFGLAGRREERSNMNPKAILHLCVALGFGQSVQAQFGYITNAGTITITNYTGAGGSVNIPAYINGLPVTSIGDEAFWNCTSVTNFTIPGTVTSIGNEVFMDCTSLTGVNFVGNAPSVDGAQFAGDDPQNLTVYYLPGTTGWSSRFAAIFTAIWSLPYPVILNSGSSFGLQNNTFGFIVSWATNASVVVEACTNLANPVWFPVATNATSGGSCYFSEPFQSNKTERFYRIIPP
jgi:hypothetical protein